MHAYLIVGEHEKFLKGLDAVIVEFPLSKIGDVRELSNFTKLKLTNKTVILIKDFDKSSEEAQNAFLKSLEEPQANLTYVLTCNEVAHVLDTIVSRCEVLEFSKNRTQSEDMYNQMVDFINSNISYKLQFISNITKRDAALKFANDAIYVGHSLMSKGSQPDVNFVENSLILKRNLELNGNIILCLTNFVASLV